MLQAVHSIHFPISARNFVMPMVQCLNENGIATELWLENQPKHAETVRHITVPRRFVDSDLSFNPPDLMRRLARYRAALRQIRPQVLHAHQTRASLIPLLAAKLERVPMRVYHNHGLPYLGYRGPLRWLLRSLEKINIGLATHVLLVSHSNLAAARTDGLLKDGAGEILANGSAVGIDLREFAPEHFDEAAQRRAKGKFGIAHAPFVLAFVGRPVKRKGFHGLLRAWEQSGLGAKANILLAAGCTGDECDRALGRHVAGVRGLGYLSSLRECYAACDAVVLPSDHEGFPYSLLEGAAAERALLGCDVPGIRCAILENQTGLLVPARDATALRRAIERLAADTALCSRLGQNARIRVERDFDRKLVLGALVRFYVSELRMGPDERCACLENN